MQHSIRRKSTPLRQAGMGVPKQSRVFVVEHGVDGEHADSGEARQAASSPARSIIAVHTTGTTIE